MIITVTLNPALSRTIVVRDFEAGRVCRAESSHLEPGGRGIELSKAVCSLGGHGVAVGVVGGAAGEYIRDQLDALGVQNDLVFTRAETRTNLKLFDASRRTVTRVDEPAAAVSVQELQEIWEKLTDLADPGDTVVFAGETPPGLPNDLLADWIGRLRQDGVRTVLDTEGLAMKIGVAACPALIAPNPAQLSELCELGLDSFASVLGAARRVASNGVSLVVVPLGPDGALFAGAREAFYAHGPAVQSAGGTVSMLASVLVDWERGAPLEETAARALAAAAAEAQPPVPEDQPPLLSQIQVDRL